MIISMKAIILLFLVACTPNLRNVNRGMLVASTASIACDWGQTFHAASRGWGEYEEANPVMGRTPSTTRVATYFIGALVINAAVWYLLPNKLKPVFSVAVTGFQSRVIYNNSQNDQGICGV